jgi:hypothetical protein
MNSWRGVDFREVAKQLSRLVISCDRSRLEIGDERVNAAASGVELALNVEVRRGKRGDAKRGCRRGSHLGAEVQRKFCCLLRQDDEVDISPDRSLQRREHRADI